MEPVSASALFAGINSAFKFAEYAVRIAEVGTENEVFVRTIQVVRNDLNEAERLLGVTSVRTRLASLPGKHTWIKASIHSTKRSLYDIGKWVEKARVDQQAFGTVRFETRVRWVFQDHEKLVNRKVELQTCHQQLSNVLSYLVPLEEVSVTHEPPTYRDTTSFDDIIAPRRRWSTTKTVKKMEAASLPTEIDVPHTARYPIPPTRVLDHCRCLPEGSSNLPLPRTAPPTYAASCQTHSARGSLAGRSGPLQLSGEAGMRSSDIRPTDSGSVAASADIFLEEGDKSERAPFNGHVEACAYVWTPGTQSVPELHGETMSLSATNRLGPVNPFELFHDSVPHINNALSSSQSMSDSNKYPQGIQGRSPSSVELASSLDACARPSPEPLAIALDRGPIPPSIKQDAARELPSHNAVDAQTLSTQDLIQYQNGQRENSNSASAPISSSSTTFEELDIVERPRHRVEQEVQGLQESSPPRFNSHSIPSPQLETTASARMRSQRLYMDLLGSIS